MTLAPVGRVRATEIDPRRLRANVLLETAGDSFVEDAWVGAELAIGEVVLRLGPGMPRCVMVDQPQSTLEVEVPILKAIGVADDVRLGLQASVLRAGRVSVGDAAVLAR